MSGGLQASLRIDRAGFSLAVDLDLPARGVTAVFGHSGSGKTTLLRAIAGLEPDARGRVQVGDAVWLDSARGVRVPVHRRRLGMVFQDARLFPHLDVRGNLAFGQQRASTAGSGLSQEAIVDWLGIAHLLDRTVDGLSGGERQRIGIARALLAAPEILLMDEPLAALDLARKREILPCLERLVSELAIPVLYVSHAPDEVARLADHLVLLEAGRAVASGPLNAVLGRLDLPASFMDTAGVVLNTELREHAADGLSRLSFAGGEIWVTRRGEAIGTALRCRVLARDVSLALSPATDSSILNCVAAVVSELAGTETPGHVLVRLSAGEVPLLARITQRSATRLGLRPGLPVYAQIKSVALLD